MNLNTAPVTITPRFGTPGQAALFVGRDDARDYFYYPVSQCAVIRTEAGERLLTQYEETAEDCALYDIAEDLFMLTTQGEVLQHV